MRPATCAIVLSALAAHAFAEPATPVVEAHGIEIELPAGWSKVDKGALTTLAPTKYKGRAIEIIALKTMPEPTKDGVSKIMGTEKVEIIKVLEADRQGVKMVLAEGKMAVKGRQIDIDMIAVPNPSGGSTMLMSFIRGDQDPLLRKANDQILLSARVAGPKMKLHITRPKTNRGGIPDDYATAVGKIATGLDSLIRLPRPLPIKVEDCGVINAFYSPPEHSIRMCHEIWDDMLAMFKNAGADDALAMKRTRGTLTFVFFHEFGHALVGELGLPITGKGEDAADEIATLLLAATGPSGQQAALEGATWFQLMAADPHRKNVFYDEHSFNSQRLVAVTCLLYGSNQTVFAPVMQQLKIPPSRLARCVRDYKDRYKAWNTLLQPYTRKAVKASP